MRKKIGALDVTTPACQFIATDWIQFSSAWSK